MMPVTKADRAPVTTIESSGIPSNTNEQSVESPNRGLMDTNVFIELVLLNMAVMVY